jgi:sn1-specific diacylglycerol lipase
VEYLILKVIFRLILIAIVCNNYWLITNDCRQGGLGVKIYLLGSISLICVNFLLLILLVNRSSQGSIVDTNARRHVAPLLVCKLLLIPPETALNVFGTIWAFCGTIDCKNENDRFSKTAVEGELFSIKFGRRQNKRIKICLKNTNNRLLNF